MDAPPQLCSLYYSLYLLLEANWSLFIVSVENITLPLLVAKSLHHLRLFV